MLHRPTEAATSCQMSEATTEKGDQQNEQQRPPGEACIEVSEQSFTDAVNNSSVQKPNTCSTPVPNDFPDRSQCSLPVWPVCSGLTSVMLTVKFKHDTVFMLLYMSCIL